MTIERSLVLVKPDGFARGLTGEVLRRIEAKGYRLVALQVMTPDVESLHSHYAEHQGKPFFEPLVDFMASGAVAAAVIEGERCIEGFRALAGATDPTAALPGRSGATSAGTGAPPSSRTSSMVPTPRSRPHARSASGSPSSERRRTARHPGVAHPTDLACWHERLVVRVDPRQGSRHRPRDRQHGDLRAWPRGRARRAVGRGGPDRDEPAAGRRQPRQGDARPHAGVGDRRPSPP